MANLLTIDAAYPVGPDEVGAPGRPEAGGNEPRPPETALHLAWRQRATGGRLIPADDGEAYRALFPGWPNTGKGPDFRGALLANSKGWLFSGDVEIHVEQDDWYRHGHHRDREYRHVVLHAVERVSPTGRAVKTVAGARVPTITLIRDDSPAQEDPRPCAPLREVRPLREIEETLDGEGQRRLEEKAGAMGQAIADHGPGQALYQGLLRALGYSRNAEPFAVLAQRLPYEAVVEALRGKPRPLRGRIAEALLLGAAGLLPSQRERERPTDAHPRILEYLWGYLRPRLAGSAPAWRWDQVRPVNAPARRVAAAAGLVIRFLDSGLVEGLREALTGGDQGSPEGVAAVHQALSVQGAGYWAEHHDFGGRSRLPPALIGPGRAADMTVNAVLPFFVALGRAREDYGLADRCMTLYRSHPPLEVNRVTKTMTGLLLPEGSAFSHTAQRQQGMIGLYKRRCSGLLCDGCRLGQGSPSVDTRERRL